MRFPTWKEVESDPEFQSLEPTKKKEYFGKWSKTAVDRAMQQGLYRDEEFASGFTGWYNQKAKEYGEEEEAADFQQLSTRLRQPPKVGTSFIEEVTKIPAAIKSAVDQPLEAFGETAEVLGAPALAQTLKGAVEAPKDYKTAAESFMRPEEGEFQVAGFAPQYIPRAIVEQAGQLAGAVATRVAGGAIGGAVGAGLGSVVPGLGTAAGAATGTAAGVFTGPAVFEMAQIVGPVAKERAKNNGRTEPTNEDLAWAWTTAGTSGALNAIGAKYIPGGEKLVGGLAKKIAASIVGEGLTESGQSVAQQTGETIFTEKGIEVSPKEAIAEGIIGGAAGGVATAVFERADKKPEDPTKAAETKAAADELAKANQAAQELSANNAPLTAKVIQDNAAKDFSAIAETEENVEEAEKFAPPAEAITREELKTQYATLSDKELVEAESTFREDLESEDAETRSFAQNALNAIADVRAEKTAPPVAPAPTIAEVPEPTAIVPTAAAVEPAAIPPAPPERTVADAIRDKDTFVFEGRRGAISEEDGITVFRPFGTTETFEVPVNPNQAISEIEGIEWARKGQTRAVPAEPTKPEKTAIIESMPEITQDEIDAEADDFEVPQALTEIERSPTLNTIADVFDTGESRVVRQGKRARKVSETPDFYRQISPEQIETANRQIDNALRIIDNMPISEEQKQELAEPYLLIDQDIANYESNPEYQRYKASIRKEVRPAGEAVAFPETITEVESGVRELEQRARAAAPTAEVETAASLSRVADNTATDEEVVRLARQGLVNIQDGQNVITLRGEEVMQRAGAPLPRLTPEERAAEVAAPAAIVEQEPVAPAEPAPSQVPAEKISPIESFKSNIKNKGVKYLTYSDFRKTNKAEDWESEGGVKIDESYYPTAVIGDTSVAFTTNGLSLINNKVIVSYESDTDSAGNKVFTIERIVTKEGKRGKGGASKALSEVTKEADNAGLTLQLEPAAVSPLIKKGGKGLTNKQLVDWYKRNGFVQKFEGSDKVLIREPKGAPPAAAPTPVTTPPVTEAVTPAPAAPAEAAPAGIAVGNRVKTKTTPQSFVVEEVLPQSAREAELGEQYYSIRNERTGEVQTVEANDIKPVKGKGARKLFAGERAEMPQFRRDSLDTARAMAATGKTTEEIRAVTGWFPGMDGKMRWEIPDQDARLITPQVKNRLQRATDWLHSQGVPTNLDVGSPRVDAELRKQALDFADQNVPQFRLGDILQHESLYAAYPEARNIPIEFQTSPEYAGMYEPARGIISIGEGIITDKSDAKLSTLLHEIQHWIQQTETFAKGGSPNPALSGIAFDSKKKKAFERIYNNLLKAAFKPLSLEEYSRQAWGMEKPNAEVKKDYQQYLKSQKKPSTFIVNEIQKDAFRQLYRNLAGEIEARDVQARKDFTQEQRDAIAPYSSENISEAVVSMSSADMAAEIRVEEKATPVPEADRYTFEEAGIRAIKFFNGKAPDGLVIVNDSTNPDYEFKAGYDPETGDIIINRAFIRKGESIEDILSHELGHYIFSDPKFQAAFQRFWNEMSDVEKANADKIINQFYNKQSGAVQIEEKKVRAFMALVEEARLLPKWKQILNAIKQWLNDKFGTNFNVTDRGALSVLAVAHKRFRKGEVIVREMNEGVLRMAAEPTPAPEVVAEEAPAERVTRRTKMQNIIDISTGVKRPRTKLTVDEMAELKKQIRIGARKRREDKQTQKEFAKDVTEYLRGMAIRGKVSAPQLRAITSKAMQTQFDNEASIKGFLNYANKVIENANYNKDISEAKAAIKSAKRLAKQKGLAGNIKANLEKLANIDPRQIEPEEMVEVDGEMPVSVAEFTAVLKEYMKAAGPVTAEGYILVPDAEITDFLSKIGEQVEVNRKANENLGLDGELAEIADKTPEEIDAELARNEERRKRIEEKVNKLAEEAQIGLVKYENPEMTSEEKLVLDDMKRITLSDISIGERKEFVKVANNILVNNKFLGAQKFASIARGQIGAAEAAKDSKTVKRNSATLKFYNVFGEDFGKLINLGTQSFADTFRNLTGTKELPRLLYQMGFGEIERGQANTNRARREITDGVQARFRQIEKDTGQKISDTQGVYSMGVAGNLIQIHPDETQAEGIQRMRGLIQSDIEKKKKSPKSEDRKAAIYIQKALDEVDSDTVEGVLENLKRLHPANHRALTFLMNEVLPEYKPMLKEHDELFNNQTENYENPYYLPIRYRSIGAEPKKPGELRGRATDSVTAPKQAPNSIKRIKNTVLPEGKQLDYNLTRNVLDSLSTQLEAAYTNPGWQQVYAFLKSPEAVDALGGVENYDFVTRRINNLSDSRERRIYQMDPFNQAADFVANMVRKIGTSIALGGIGQAAKQMPDQVATTIANVNDLSITTPAFTEIKAALPAMRQFSIGERGEIAGGSKWVNQLEGNFTKLQQFMQDGLWPKAMEAFENINNFWLIPLKVSDTVAASHGWISYYKKYLKDNNIPFTNWDNEAELIAGGERGRVEAGLYADQMIDLYQGSSDPTKMATFAQRGDSGGGNLLKTMIMPFSSFVIQQRSRILSDLRDVSYGDADEKKVAAKGLAGTLLGIVIFHGVRRYALPLLTGGVAAGAYGLLGVDMEEPDEEERAEKDKRVFRQFLGEVASNIFVGGYSAYAETRLIDAVNAASYFYEIQTGSENVLDDEGEIMSWEKYRKERAPMYRYTGPGADSTLGMIDILPSQTRETFDRLKDLSDDEIMDSLTEEEQRVLILAALSETLYTMRLNDADVARMIKRMAKDVKDQAEARQKAERQLQRLYGL